LRFHHVLMEACNNDDQRWPQDARRYGTYASGLLPESVYCMSRQVDFDDRYGLAICEGAGARGRARVVV